MSDESILRTPVPKTYTASERVCPHCEGTLWICQHRGRTIHGLDESIKATFRDTGCHEPGCRLGALRYRPAEEAMLALPASHFGLDVLMGIGSMRVRNDFSFPRIWTRLIERGVPIGQMTVQYQFRNYLSLVSCQAAVTNGKVRKRLKEQGMILPVIDGVQFGEGDPVLYVITDELSGYPLFGKELFCRGAEELIPFIAQLTELELPILAAVSDKEKGLVPAIQEALPGVPHQFCQFHYVKNAAKPMEADLKALGVEVRDTEGQLRKLQRSVMRQQQAAEKKGEELPADLEVTRELCEAARAMGRCHGRAPFDPPALKRHQGLETVHEAAAKAKQKKGAPGRTSRS